MRTSGKDYGVIVFYFESYFHLERFVISFLDDLYRTSLNFNDVLVWIIKFYSKDNLTSGF